MTTDGPQDTFWSLVAAYIDADDPEQLRRDCGSALFEKVALHVESCTWCQDRQRAVRAKRAGEQRNADDEI